jgi:excisionase family DNA binding protein
MDMTEVAEYLGITRGAVRDAVARGKLVAERRGGTEKKAGYLRFAREEVERYKRENSGKRGFASADHPLHRGNDDAE